MCEGGVLIYNRNHQGSPWSLKVLKFHTLKYKALKSP